MTDNAVVRILLVEDNPDDIRLTRHALAKHGLTNALRVVTTGAAALDVLRDHVPEAGCAGDLVLLDLGLPGMSGLEVLGAIRSDPTLRQIPVIVLTGANAFDDIEGAYTSGADAVMFKPIDFGQLADRSAELGLGWQLVDPQRRTSHLSEGREAGRWALPHLTKGY